MYSKKQHDSQKSEHHIGVPQKLFLTVIFLNGLPVKLNWSTDFLLTCGSPNMQELPKIILANCVVNLSNFPDLLIMKNLITSFCINRLNILEFFPNEVKLSLNSVNSAN